MTYFYKCSEKGSVGLQEYPIVDGLAMWRWIDATLLYFEHQTELPLETVTHYPGLYALCIRLSDEAVMENAEKGTSDQYPFIVGGVPSTAQQYRWETCVAGTPFSVCLIEPIPIDMSGCISPWIDGVPSA